MSIELEFFTGFANFFYAHRYTHVSKSGKTRGMINSEGNVRFSRSTVPLKTLQTKEYQDLIRFEYAEELYYQKTKDKVILCQVKR